MKRKFESDSQKNYNLELNQERAFWENQLNQKINFFLLFFALIVAGVAFSKSKDFTLSVLLVGSIILWFLSLTIINATRKINLVIKELMKDDSYPASLIDRRASGRLFRIIVGYGLPIFCALIVTATFIAGTTGLYSFGFTTTNEVVKTVEKAVENVKDKIASKPKTDSTGKFFKTVDAAIADGNQQVVIVDSLPKAAPVKSSQKIPIQKSVDNKSTHFHAVDNVIAEENAKQYIVPPLPSNQQVTKQSETSVTSKTPSYSRELKSIERKTPTIAAPAKTADSLKISAETTKQVKTVEITKPVKTVPIQK